MDRWKTAQNWKITSPALRRPFRGPEPQGTDTVAGLREEFEASFMFITASRCGFLRALPASVLRRPARSGAIYKAQRRRSSVVLIDQDSAAAGVSASPPARQEDHFNPARNKSRSASSATRVSSPANLRSAANPASAVSVTPVSCCSTLRRSRLTAAPRMSELYERRST